ncbi:glutaredoxin-C9-like [Primulina eburnea]|uniref:glutaredoxin-C9-like n=1 Tax=Primulina eburnea TaxID=1245227 RepID=UPI003C6BF83E
MQQALPYKDWFADTATASAGGTRGSSNPPPGVNDYASVSRMVSENAVIVFARKDCCMCHVVKLLLHGHGVNPTVFDVDEANEDDVVNELSRIIGVDGSGNATRPQFPAVFVGGEIFGGLEEVMGAHISGELVPRLREAGALWL